jgi:hypothetical protein
MGSDMRSAGEMRVKKKGVEATQQEHSTINLSIVLSLTNFILKKVVIR